MFTVVIPFWRGNSTLGRLLSSLPSNVSVIIAQDKESDSPEFSRRGVKVIELDKRGYFSGACNAAIDSAGNSDILILNQDTWFTNNEWVDLINRNKDRYAVIGDAVMGHPAWQDGYVQGTFMFLRNDVIKSVGKFNTKDYPLWGATCEYQLRAIRKGYNVLPVSNIPGLNHEDRGRGQVGSSIAAAMQLEPEKSRLFFRTPPEISVIVPCYNYGHFLQEAIDSLMRQTFQSFEIVIVDDASTDGSGAIAEKMQNKLAGIRVIRHAKNKGTAATINTGVASAFGRYITVLSADDMFEPDRLERMYRASLSNPHSVICDDILWKTDRETVRKYMGWRENKDEQRHYDFDVLLERNHMHCGIMYPRKAWIEVGGYPNVMDNGREDWAFNVALGRAGYCGVFIDYAGYIVRRHGGNRSLTNSNQHREFLSKLSRLFPDVYRGVRPMGCCGSRISGGGNKATKPLSNKELASLMQAGDVFVKYTGKNSGATTWYGKTGRQYKFGKSARYQVGWVAPEDLQTLLDTKQFRVSQSPVKPHPKPVEVKEIPEPELDTEIETLESIAEERKPLEIEPETEEEYQDTELEDDEEKPKRKRRGRPRKDSQTWTQQDY